MASTDNYKKEFGLVPNSFFVILLKLLVGPMEKAFIHLARYLHPSLRSALALLS